MRQPYRLLARTAVLVLNVTCGLAMAQVSFREFVEGCLITSMSADGSVAVGNYGGGSNADGFRWTAAGGVELIGLQGGFLNPLISRDGTTIVGSVPDSAGNLNADRK